METAPAGIFLPLAVLLALGLISTDSSPSRQGRKYNNCYVTTEITVNADLLSPSVGSSLSFVSAGFSSANNESS